MHPLRSLALLLVVLIAFAGLLASRPAPRVQFPAHRLAGSFPTSAAQWRPRSPLYPPAVYQASADVVAIFGDAAEIQELCAGSAKIGPREMILGCEGEKDGTHVIAVPNPCLMPHTDFYAAIVCHELGHVNGWRHGD